MSAWSVALVRALADGPLVYHRLLERLDGISPRELVLTLRTLEGSGLVEQRMERAYGLTSAGRGLLPVLDS